MRYQSLKISAMPKQALSPDEIQIMQEQIMDQTATVLAINGVAQLSMRAIAKHTGMTAANLYNYFESKEALFIATKRRGFRLLDGFTTMPANTDEPPREQIKFILKGALQFAREWPGYWELIVHPPRGETTMPESSLLVLTDELPNETVKRMMRVFTDLLTHSGIDVNSGESPGDPPRFDEISSQGFGPDTVWVRIIALLTHTHGLLDLYSRGMLGQFRVDVDPLVDTLLEASIDILLPAEIGLSEESGP
jgi:AcrR family transcriptional regulator